MISGILQLVLVSACFGATPGWGFVLSDNCPAPVPCSCHGTSEYAIIACELRDLTSIPQFKTATVQTKKLVLNMFGNKIGIIPREVFRNLASFNASTIEIQLNNNNITYIDDDAFGGIERTVTILQLQFNELTSLPSAIGKLHSLEYIDVTNNSLSSIPPLAVQGISRTLTTLRIDLGSFNHWPDVLSSLQALTVLQLSSLNFRVFNVTAFHGFQALSDLSIEGTSIIEQITAAACRLSSLKNLRLRTFETPSKGTPILNHCFAISNIKTLEIANHLDNVPDNIFSAFPALADLQLGENSLEFVEAEYVPTSNVLNRLDLNTNKLKRIPTVVNKMAQLTFLELRENVIMSIEAGDLDGATNLQILSVRNNPLKYISTNVFKFNTHLAQINLEYTYLTSVPAALTTLPNLVNLDLSHTNIACTCQMSYLKGWNISDIASFRGECVNLGVDLKYFVIASVPACP